MQTPQLVTWLEQAAGSLFAIVLLSAAIRAWAEGDYRKVIGALPAGAIGLALATGIFDDLARWTYATARGLLEAPAATDAAPSPLTHPSGPAAHAGSAFTEGDVLAALAVLLGAAVLGTAVAAAFRALQLRRDRAARRAQLERRWASVQADHEQVLDEWTSYITDPLAYLDRPALGDTAVPETVSFLHALDAANDASAGSDLEDY